MVTYPVGFSNDNSDSDSHYASSNSAPAGTIVYTSAGNTYLAIVDRAENPKLHIKEWSDSDGSADQEIGTYNGGTPGDGEFRSPDFVTIDGTNFYVSDSQGDDRIQKFNSAGVHQDTLTLDTDEVIDSILYYGSTLLVSVYHAGDDDHELRSYDSSLTLGFTGATYVSSDLRHVVKTTNWLIGYDSFDDRIRSYDANYERVVNVIPGSGVIDLGVNPTGAAYVYLLNGSNEIERFDEDLTGNTTIATLSTETIGTITLAPRALDFDSGGYAYVNWSGGSVLSYVVKYDPTAAWSIEGRRANYLGLGTNYLEQSTFAAARTADLKSATYRTGSGFAGKTTWVDYNAAQPVGIRWSIYRCQMQIDTRDLVSVPAAMDLVLYIGAVTNGSGVGELVLAEGANNSFNSVPYDGMYTDFHSGAECAARTALSGLTASSTVTISLNATGLANINPGGFTTFSLMIGWDYDNVDPGWVSTTRDRVEYFSGASHLSYLTEPSGVVAGYAVVI